MRVLRYLIVLLIDEGQGWLRWGWSSRTAWAEWHEEYTVAPPLRRAAWCVKSWAEWVFNVHGLRHAAPFDWTPTRGFYRDEDRPTDLRNAWLGSYRAPWAEDDDPLRAARGILIGFCIGLAMWAVGIAMWAVLR